MLDVFADLADKLGKHSTLKWEIGARFMRINAPDPDGFAVELERQGEEFTIYLGNGGWHRHFDDPTEVLEFVAWCFSGRVRLREIRRGASIQKAVLEALGNGRWEEEATTGYFFVPFWRKKRELILQNPDLLSAT
jgi:hypothetical protein